MHYGRAEEDYRRLVSRLGELPAHSLAEARLLIEAAATLSRYRTALELIAVDEESAATRKAKPALFS